MVRPEGERGEGSQGPAINLFGKIGGWKEEEEEEEEEEGVGRRQNRGAEWDRGREMKGGGVEPPPPPPP